MLMAVHILVAAGCVTTQCTDYDNVGEVTVTNYFGDSIDYMAAEYEDESGNKMCSNSKCAFHLFSCCGCHVTNASVTAHDLRTGN